mgnify:CR=1 FL=1
MGKSNNAIASTSKYNRYSPTNNSPPSNSTFKRAADPNDSAEEEDDLEFMQQTFIKEQPEPIKRSPKKSPPKKRPSVKREDDESEEDRKPTKKEIKNGKKPIVKDESSASSEDEVDTKNRQKRKPRQISMVETKPSDATLPLRSSMEEMCDDEWREFVIKFKHLAGRWRKSKWSQRNPDVMSSYRKDLEMRYNPLIKLLGNLFLAYQRRQATNSSLFPSVNRN